MGKRYAHVFGRLGQAQLRIKRGSVDCIVKWVPIQLLTGLGNIVEDKFLRIIGLACFNWEIKKKLQRGFIQTWNCFPNYCLFLIAGSLTKVPDFSVCQGAVLNVMGFCIWCIKASLKEMGELCEFLLMCQNGLVATQVNVENLTAGENYHYLGSWGQDQLDMDFGNQSRKTELCLDSIGYQIDLENISLEGFSFDDFYGLLFQLVVVTNSSMVVIICFMHWDPGGNMNCHFWIFGIAVFEIVHCCSLYFVTATIAREGEDCAICIQPIQLQPSELMSFEKTSNQHLLASIQVEAVIVSIGSVVLLLF